MKLGRDLRKGLDWHITCWKSPNDPSPGDFSLGLVVRDYPVYYMMNGTQKVYCSEPWNGLYFSGFLDLSFTYIFEDSFVINKDEISYSYNTKVDSIIGRGLKVPDTQHTKLHENINLDECRNLCLKNCSCMAYANSDIRGGGSRCAMWFGDLIDIKLFQKGGIMPIGRN
ncbi:hypothetical protein AHAS_Ahas16G0197100 [Arachis hypogaea]